MRYLAYGGRRGRLAKLAAIPLVGAIIAACTEQANNQNPTGDDAAPNLFGDAGNGLGFPHQVVTEQGIASADLYLPVFLIAVAIFIVVEGLLLWSVLRYRKRSKGDDLPEQTHGNNMLELLWTAVPMIIVLVLFVVSTNVLVNDVEARSSEHGAVVNVTAFHPGWTYDYQDPASFDAETGSYEPLVAPDSDQPISATGNGREFAPVMVLPVGESVLIRLTALDVIHSWYVPAFFFKRDAIPGRLNEFEFTISQPGTYGGQCAEFCGTSHGNMFFSVEAVVPELYDEWVANGGDFPEAEDAGESVAEESSGEEA